MKPRYSVRRKGAGTRESYGYQSLPVPGFTTLVLSMITAATLAMMHDDLVIFTATIFNLSVGFGIAYGFYLACCGLLNVYRFQRWASRTYGLALTRRDASALLRGRWVQDVRASVVGGFAVLRSRTGELPRAGMPTAEIPDVVST